MKSPDRERIAPLNPPYPNEAERHLGSLMPKWSTGVEPLRLFRIWARHLPLAEGLRGMGSYILGRGLVDPDQRELLILRVTALCGAEYEWGVHAVGMSPRSGLSQECIDATVHGDAADESWSPEQSLLIRFADELHATSTVSEGLWAGMRECWNEEQLLELVLIVGFYHLVSYTVNAVRVEAEPWSRSFPVLEPDTTES